MNQCAVLKLNIEVADPNHNYEQMTTLPSLTATPLPAPAGASDPLSSFLSTTCMDLLLIELVPLAKSLAARPLPLTDNVFLDTNPTAATDLDDDSERENMYFRLEPLGFRVGQGIAERSLSYLWLCVEFVDLVGIDLDLRIPWM